jgi:arginase family enzyme
VNVALLHLDDALTVQDRLRRAVREAGGRLVDCRDLGPALRLWSRPPALAQLRHRLSTTLPVGLGPALVFCGSGDFHHVTPLLLERAIEAAGRPDVTVLHFDNHPDWVKFSPGAHCGSWVGHAARLPEVRKVITVGVCSDDIDRPHSRGADLSIVERDLVELYPYRAPREAERLAVAGREWPSIESMGEAAFADFLPGRIATEAVYVTIDKDVLRAQDAGTNWDQGRTSLAFLKTLVDRAVQGRRLIGADVVGDWSKAVYGGGLVAWALKAGEARLDQPWRAPPLALRAANEDVNLELMQLITGAAA